METIRNSSSGRYGSGISGTAPAPRLSHKLRVLRPMFIYMLVYFAGFLLIEHWNRLHYTVIHTAVDDLIPFCPVFVIPYVLWFPYVIGSVLFLLMKNEEAYHRVCSVLATGMTVFILVSVVYPNIHLMRPQTMPDNSIFSKMVALLYMADTPTNLTPSIHVFNSLAVIAAFWKWDWQTESGYVYPRRIRRAGRAFLTFLGLLISVSTMLIKQHSFSDIVMASVLFVFIYIAVYHFDLLLIGGRPGRFRPRRREDLLRPTQG